MTSSPPDSVAAATIRGTQRSSTSGKAYTVRWALGTHGKIHCSATALAGMAPEPPKPGEVFWQDLTVEDAEDRAEFYESVLGWEASPHPMDGYVDYDMDHPETGQTMAGVCHARGENADVPAEWLLYVAVADLDARLAACREAGGTVVTEKRPSDGHDSAVIEDPGGAVLALFEVET